jgi:hypothetical protein
MNSFAHRINFLQAFRGRSAEIEAEHCLFLCWDNDDLTKRAIDILVTAIKDEDGMLCMIDKITLRSVFGAPFRKADCVIIVFEYAIGYGRLVG